MKSDTLSKIVRFGLSEGLVRFIPFITVFSFAKAFDSQLVGKLALLIITLEVFTIFISNNSAALVRIEFFKKSSLSFRDFLFSLYGNSLWIYAITFLCSLLSFVFFNVSTSVYLLLAVPLLKSYSLANLAIVQCSKNTNLYLAAQMLFVFTYLVVFFVFFDEGIFAWSLAMLISSFVQATFLFKASSKSNNSISDYRHNFSFHWKVYKEGLAFMPQAMGWWIRSGAERYLVAAFFSVSLLGEYVLAFQISAIAVLIVTAINLAIVPEINTLLSKESSGYSGVNKIYKFVSLLLSFAMLVLWIIGSIFIESFYPDYKFSSDILWLTCLSSFFQALSMVFMNELYFKGKALQVAKSVASIFSIQTLLSFILLSIFDSVFIVLIVNSLFAFTLFATVLFLIMKIRSDYVLKKNVL
ncbi:hypothetical protein [Pseudoalteromonas sp. T1lg23B]|uniref:hypothetical protein n=1 Tax=Pseudoalteromonas sp. T1lg23B TaxID=2077097 RepID=UPI00131A43AC|nr:hypothetical protein [Pseudoalteromonas sp. T1lg23B]